MNVRIDHAVTSGTFSLDGETHEVDNNVWVLGDDTQCVVFDAPHDLKTVLDLVGGRECAGLLMTHSHDDHARLAPELATELEAPVLLNPADREEIGRASCRERGAEWGSARCGDKRT